MSNLVKLKGGSEFDAKNMLLTCVFSDNEQEYVFKVWGDRADPTRVLQCMVGPVRRDALCSLL